MKFIPRSGKTPLFSKLQHVFRILRSQQRLSSPRAIGARSKQLPLDELSELIRARSISRREFLKSAAYGSILLGSSRFLSACTNTGNSTGKFGDPRIAIIGAGIAGLNAAYQLSKFGVSSLIFEASSRSGGRMYSSKNVVGPELVTELGGEFVDSIHDDIISLAAEFGLELLDTAGPGENQLLNGYFFNGQNYTESQIIEAFAPLAERIAQDFDSTGDVVDFQNDGGARDLDNTSLAEYFDKIGAQGFIRQLLEVAYVTEYGLESAEQSALNLIFLIGTDTSSGFKIFGDSDERYKIKGGNQRVPEELTTRLEPQIRYEHQLSAIQSRGTGYRLIFEGSIEIDCDVLLLTLPFSILRNVDIQVELPSFKQKAIRELGYGTNAKIFVGFSKKLWREIGMSGEAFSDEEFQLCWDNTRLQDGEMGGLTFYSGGTRGILVGEGSARDQADRLLPGANRLFPGISDLKNGRVQRFHWPSYKYTLGSYSAFKPGQWTSIAGSEIVPVGNIYFAGEHCSYDFQGYMNGGAETGRRAAEAILQKIGAIPTN